MLTIIIIAVLLVVGFGVYKGVSSKRHSQKNTGEKIISTVGAKVERGFKGLANNLNNPEELKQQILEKLEKAEVTLKEDVKKHLAGQLMAQSTLETIGIQSKSTYKQSMTNAKKWKKKYEEAKALPDTDESKSSLMEKYKDLTLKFLATARKAEMMGEDAKNKLKDMQHVIEDAKANYSITSIELANKKQEITLMVLNPENNYKLAKLNIDDLVSDYKEKMTTQNINVEVENIVGGYDDNTIVVEDPAVEELFDNL